MYEITCCVLDSIAQREDGMRVINFIVAEGAHQHEILACGVNLTSASWDAFLVCCVFLCIVAVAVAVFFLFFLA